MKSTPNEIDKLLKAEGYKFLGWENDSKVRQIPEYIKCHQENHKRDTVDHDNRGLEHTVSCDECKLYWKYDSSD